MQPQRERFLEPSPPPLVRQRGGCLTFWLLFFGVAHGFFMYAAARQGVWLVIVWSVLGVLAAGGVWWWYRLAWYMMLAVSGFFIAVSLDSQDVLGVMWRLVFLGLTYFLVQQKQEYLR